MFHKVFYTRQLIFYTAVLLNQYIYSKTEAGGIHKEDDRILLLRSSQSLMWVMFGCTAWVLSGEINEAVSDGSSSIDCKVNGQIYSG